jgi:hypothetical protein
MSRHSPKTTREARIAWLKENAFLINRTKDLDDLGFLKGLALAMKNAGLYATSTGLMDIAYRLPPLIKEAKKC